MKRLSTIVIGAGQCGLAMSKCLSRRSIEHIVLDRGQVANSWRTERWDSLHLLTPNWQSRMPGDHYVGLDRDEFMRVDALVARFDKYAKTHQVPIQTETEVLSVNQACGGYQVVTNQGEFLATNLVLASGACNIAQVPSAAAGVPDQVFTTTPLHYKRPDNLPDGGVLIVGASATGVQLAQEIRASGRPVILSVGNHIRVPRTYRGWDIKWWMNAMGLFDLHFEDVDDLARVRRTPSMQLVGSADKRMLDLNMLQQAGVEIVGRFAGMRDSRIQFSGSLSNACAMSDLKMNRLLDAIDGWANENCLDSDIDPPQRFAATRSSAAPRIELDLKCGEISSILWAAGYRPDYSWLQVPVLDRKGRLRHHGGIADAPGLYAMGLPFMRRRKSTLIDGAGSDAQDLVDHMTSQIGCLAA